MSRIKITIIASMYNGDNKILEIIDKLFFPGLLNNASKDKELIILDDCSPLKNETRKIINKYKKELIKKFGRFNFIENQENLGFARSYNKGMKMAKGEKLIISNDDVYYPKNSINALCHTLGLNLKIGAVLPVTNNAYGFHNSRLYNKLKNYSPEEINKIEQFALWQRRVMNGIKYKAILTDNLTGFCIAINKSFLEDIDYFDERYEYGMSEDIDLFHKIISKNKDLIIDTATFVEHGGLKRSSGSILQHPKKAIFSYISNGLKYSHKWNSYGIFGIGMILSLIRFNDFGFTITKIIKKQAKKNNLWDEYKKLVE